jgi:hypothetical protein
LQKASSVPPGQRPAILTEVFLLFSSFSPGKCWDSILN